MPVFQYEGKSPLIGKGSYVFPTATVIGNVRIGENTWIGPGAVLRGDYGTIEVGSFSAVEDNCVLHARPGEKTVIGDHVTLGHGSVVHTAHVKDWAVVGMGAVVSDFAEVGEWAAIGEGAVVRSKASVADRKVAVGIPAKEIASVNDDYIELWTAYKERYNDFCRKYRESLSGTT